MNFGNLQVIPVAEEYSTPEIISSIWIYEEDGIVKGLIHIEGKEVVELYVDYFFQGQGIGSKLIEFAKDGEKPVAMGRALHVKEENNA